MGQPPYVANGRRAEPFFKTECDGDGPERESEGVGAPEEKASPDHSHTQSLRESWSARGEDQLAHSHTLAHFFGPLNCSPYGELFNRLLAPLGNFRMPSSLLSLSPNFKHFLGTSFSGKEL